MHNLSEVKQDIQAALGDDFNVLDRRDQDASVYRIVKKQRFFMVVILAFIVGIISFNVIAALSMLIMEKRHDIIMLRALGAERKTIFSLYLFQGMFGAAIATILGIGIGALIVMAQDRFGFIHFPQLNPEAMPIPYPVDLRLMDVLLITAIILWNNLFGLVVSSLAGFENRVERLFIESVRRFCRPSQKMLLDQLKTPLEFLLIFF